MEHRISRTKLKKLNDKEQAFLENFFDPEYNGDIVLAYINAGYSDGPKARSNAVAKLRELGEHVTMRAFDRVGTHVPWAINQLVILATTAKTEMVRLKCLQDILDRAGLNKPLIVEDHSKNDPKALTSKEIAVEVARLLEKAGKKPDLKVVGGTAVDE